VNKDQSVTLDEVAAAFDALLEVVGRECDGQTAQTVYWAKVDVLAILAGDWEDKGRADVVDVVDEEVRL